MRFCCKTFAAAAATSFTMLGVASAHAAGGPDLTVSTSTPSGAVGNTVTVTLTMKNIGSGTATGTTLRLTAPAGTAIVNEKYSDCTVSSDAQNMTCRIKGSAAPGFSVDSPIQLKIRSTAAYQSLGSVTLSNGKDINPANNTAAIQVKNPDNGGLPGLPSGSSG